MKNGRLVMWSCRIGAALLLLTPALLPASRAVAGGVHAYGWRSATRHNGIAGRAPSAGMAHMWTQEGGPAPQPALAAPVSGTDLTFTVNSTADTNDANPGDGICADAAGKCTLRAAIQEADAQPSGSSITIGVPAGTYGLILGTLQLTANRITISGALSSTTIISGNNTSTILAISHTVQADVSQITITGGKAAGPMHTAGGILNAGLTVLTQSAVLSNTARYGGGILNVKGARLSLVGSTLSGNVARGGGGGIYNSGTVSVTNSTLSGNSAVEACCDYGGGIDNAGGSMNVSASTFSNNTGTYGAGIFNSGTLNITGSTFSGDSVYYYGGGLYNLGTATVSSSTFSGNTAGPEYGAGGAIYSRGTVSVTNCTFNGNTALFAYGGGAIFDDVEGGLSVTSSTFSGNSSSMGGAIFSNDGAVTIASSTFSNNTASNVGGGIVNSIGTATVTNSTFSGNTAGSGGGIANGCTGYYFCGAGTLVLSFDTIASDSTGINNINGSVALAGTIVANSTAGPNCGGLAMTDGGYNLDSGSSCGFSKTTDISNASPLLGPLANNGGPTQTMALLTGSPAIDHGGTSATGCPATDQRGMPRPDEAADSGACDMGAYESQGVG